jgi:hypothetical protein
MASDLRYGLGWLKLACLGMSCVLAGFGFLVGVDLPASIAIGLVTGIFFYLTIRTT